MTLPNGLAWPTFLVTLVVALIGGCGGGTATPSAVTAPVVVVTPDQQAGGAGTVAAPPSLATSPNPNGLAATYSVSGPVDPANPFFKSFGNGRSCATCHQMSDGWSITPSSIQARFKKDPNDPLFMPADGANSPLADMSTPRARQLAYSMLLTKGVIRFDLAVPGNAEFVVDTVEDPYGYASAQVLSVFRRPLPTANLKYLSTVMWDARDTLLDRGSDLCLVGTASCYGALALNLALQANHAVKAHAQANQELSAEDLAAILRFETGLFTAQVVDNAARNLTGRGGLGGPMPLADSDFYFGQNDFDAGDYRTKKPFTTQVIALYNTWQSTTGTLEDPDTPAADVMAVTAARQSIARGQALFNNFPIFINNVGGMRNASVRGTCTSCHDTPLAGGHSTPLLLNLGVADGTRRTSDMPLYTLRNKTTGETIQTTDPGAAMSTGKWQDVGRFKVPALRALASRPPYFHDGSASSLADVVKFYNDRFKIGFTDKEMADLTAFLDAL
jgi:cytochrome c peroxidase